MRVEPRGLGFDGSVGLEWILANGLGGYSSSTVLGLNTRKYHGLLVASFEGLRRMVCLQKMDDLVDAGGSAFELHCSEFDGGVLSVPGLESLVEFRRGLNEAYFLYESPEFSLGKSVNMPYGKNAAIVSYTAFNKTKGELTHVVRPHVSYRSIHELSREGDVAFEVRLSGAYAGVSAGGRSLLLSSPEGSPMREGFWVRNVFYRLEAERGYPAVEDSFVPFSFSFRLRPGERRDYHVVAALDGVTVSDEELLNARGSYESDDMVMLLSSAKSFVVEVDGGKTVVAGYPWFGEWGRDAMISLPGLALVGNRVGDARLLIERFLSRVRDGRIMTHSVDGSLVYGDFDSTLWMVDRILQYIKYAGPGEGRRFLGRHWEALSDVMEFYAGLVRGGLLSNEDGTWMDTLRRDRAVEVQALWYNALKVFGRLSGLAGRRVEAVDLPGLVEGFESSFMKEFWGGGFLCDCAGDSSLRPNQLFALSLEHPCVGVDGALSILSVVDERLLTPFGLRTLTPDDGRYRGSYVGGVESRELSYHNGTVWPWLFGPYVTACLRFRGGGDRMRLRRLLSGFFRQALSVGALGSISEVFDGEPPHTPRGCVSQAWSVAEPLRAYIEDVLGRRPPFESSI